MVSPLLIQQPPRTAQLRTLAPAQHRWKTHGGYRSRVVGPGRHLWITPHGLTLLVDHTGTHRLDDHQADAMVNAPDGAEIYFSKVALS